jgi:argininosuccinate synthase
MNHKKVVLAYSGGLDTSCAVRWIRDNYDAQVICFSAFIGEVSDRKLLERKAFSAGASKIYIRDLKAEFANDFLLPALWARARYEGKYFLATALGRPLIAKHLVRAAEAEGAEFVAHGCTGKGNDQVRIEVGVRTLNPKLKIIAPLREWSFRSREEEIDYAKKHKILISATKKSPYSIDKNIWGAAIEAGILEDLGKEALQGMAVFLTQRFAQLEVAQNFPDDPEEGLEGDALHVVTMDLIDRDAPLRRRQAKLPEHPGLSDSGLAAV